MSAWGDVGKVSLVGEGGDELVAAMGQVGGNAGFGVGKGGEDEQPAVGQRLSPFRQDALGQRSRRADDDGLLAAKQDSEAFLFNGRVKAADDATSGVAPIRRLVVGREDGAARTAGGTKECGLGKG